MSFSTSGGTIVLMIGVVISISILVGAIDAATEQTVRAEDEKSQRELFRENADIEITSASYDGGANEVTIQAQNTGTKTLSLDRTQVLIDGEYVTPASTEVNGDTNTRLWEPGTDLTIVVDGVTNNPNRVVVNSETGISATTSNI